ncbi:hypothetical protein [Pontibacter cellulosilyticus]|uniref:Transporter n=1 Tax=Pontibacter cellulosilyticus TaxID=1720253 RepID=A0A923SL64_9BACT|nr:hypothetical protein [Pontibacter cellulosilyticus]MBC5994526.1 hypothetical protein [Pontibacter cellulosilyticus]
MKKYILLALALIAISTNSKACDKGCTMGGSYFGILPQFQKNFAGLRYSTRAYTITASHGGHTEVTEEHFTTAELWGRYVPVKNLQIFAFVPYLKNEQNSSHGKLKNDGFGDITLMANYAILNTGDSLRHTIKHSLQLGGGIKLATGTYQQEQHEEVMPINMQTGTGSTDYLLNGIYTIRYKQLGLSNDVTYRFNTENKEGYRFGDRISASSNVFYWQNAGAVALLPSAGVYYEHAQSDRINGATNAQKGGESYFGNVGLSAYIKNISLSGTLQLPISSTEDYHATKGNNRTMLSLTYMF